MVGKAKLGERDEINEIKSSSLSSTAVRAAVSSFLQQEGELYLLVWDNNNNDNTNNNNNDNLQQGGSGLFLSVLKQALLLVGWQLLHSSVILINVTDVLLIFFFGLYHFSVTFIIFPMVCLSLRSFFFIQWSERGGMESKSATNAKISQHGCCIQTQQKRMNFLRQREDGNLFLSKSFYPQSEINCGDQYSEIQNYHTKLGREEIEMPKNMKIFVHASSPCESNYRKHIWIYRNIHAFTELIASQQKYALHFNITEMQLCKVRIGK